MSSNAEEIPGVSGFRQRTASNSSEQSLQSSKKIFPLITSDSGLYTCSSNTSDCSLQLESDTDSYHQNNRITCFKDGRLQLALQDVRKLRSELERLTKSEQWYKQELRQQKSTRLDDLERIYTQERKFMQENQRLQKECLKLYEKCNELERELEKQSHETHEYHFLHADDDESSEENILEFEKEQQVALIKDQQQLISVLRKQKRSLLEELKCLTEEKDEKVVELQRLLVDLEFDNKLITKRFSQVAKERLSLENNLKKTDNKIDLVQEENMNLKKSIVDLKEQVEIQKQLLKLKESEIEHIKHHYTHKIHHEQDLDQVHELSIMYQEQINTKTLDIINLKQRLQELQNELEEMKNLQQQNELQQMQIDQLNFSLETYRLELQELKISETHKNNQLDKLHTAVDQLIRDKELAYKMTVQQQNELLRVKQDLKNTQEQYEKVQELYKTTQFKLELLQVEEGKLKFQTGKDLQEIEKLRNKLKEYLQQTAELGNKIQYLETELAKTLKENLQLKTDSKQMEKLTENIEEQKNQQSLLDKPMQTGCEDANKYDSKIEFLRLHKSFIQIQELEKIPEDQDFLDFQQKCEMLQKNIDFIRDTKWLINDGHDLQHISETMTNVNKVKNITADCPEKDIDIINISLQGNKIQENLEKLNVFLTEKQHLLQNSNDSVGKTVTENEALRKNQNAIETAALTLQINENINERTEKYTKIKEHLENRIAEVACLQETLLLYDGKLYKLERKLKTIEKDDTALKDLQLENTKLKECLRQEQTIKDELTEKHIKGTEKLKELEQSLEELKINRTTKTNQAIQCMLPDSVLQENSQLTELNEHVLQLQQQQKHFQEQEAYKKEERLMFLRQIMDLQNNKILNIQNHQKDWEDILTSLNNAHSLEEKTRQELELKRMELEELNQVFEEQNDELRKLEEFTAHLESKMQQEKEQLKQTFQKEINVMKQQLQDYRKEIEQQKLVNQELENRNNRFQQDINEDRANEVAGYKKEIRELKSKVSRIIEEKEDILENFKDLEKQTKDLKDNKREAILMPDISVVQVKDISAQTSVETVELLQQNVSEDHLRILTKVLEAEYQRKMIRYDEHIHSLLSNLKCLKKSLKINEEKTALLSEEQLKTKEELLEFQDTKRSLEEMRLKYEQSQNTIKELKDTLALERKKFELSDLGKSSQNSGTTYEVSNLIDDYKKLIQQSALSTKRPSTSAILDLIQRSNQCVPNLKGLETNFGDLRSELQNFLSSYSHKIPATSLIATASLSVPPSLMDELRAASEGF